MVFHLRLPPELLRNLLIAVIMALVVTLAPAVRSDTVRFVYVLFTGGSHTAAVTVGISK